MAFFVKDNKGEFVKFWLPRRSNELLAMTDSKKKVLRLENLEHWGVEDSNLWRREPRDLQSLAIAAMRTPH